MWILFLLLQINFNNHTEYWLYTDSLREHFESVGTISYQEKKFLLLADYFIEDNMETTPKSYLLYPLLNFHSSNASISIGYFQNTYLSGMLLNQTHDIQFKRFRYIKGISLRYTLKNTTFTLFTGNPHDQEFNGFTYTSTQDTTSILRCISQKTRFKYIEFSSGYIRLNRKNMPEPSSFSEIMGTRIDFNKENVSFSLALAFKNDIDFIAYTRKRGRAFFLSTEYTTHNLNLLLQLAKYDSIEFYNLNLPPTPLKTEILPSSGNSDKGGSITLFIPVKNGNLEAGIGGVYSNEEHNYINPKKDKAFQEAYVQNSSYSKNINYSIKLGYEHRLRIEPEYTHLRNVYLAANLDLIPISSEIHSGIDRYHEDSTIYFKTFLNFTLYLVDWMNTQLLLEHTTKKLPRYDFENTWYGIELNFNIIEGNISIFYGKQRGGLVCSGGMCRLTPRFNGIKLMFQKSI